MSESFVSGTAGNLPFIKVKVARIRENGTQTSREGDLKQSSVGRSASAAERVLACGGPTHLRASTRPKKHDPSSQQIVRRKIR